MTTTEQIQEMTEAEVIASLAALDRAETARLERLVAEQTDWLQRLQERAWHDADTHSIGSAADDLMEQLGLKRRPRKLALTVRAQFEQRLHYDTLPRMAQDIGFRNRSDIHPRTTWVTDLEATVPDDDGECACPDREFLSVADFLAAYPQFIATGLIEAESTTVTISALNCNGSNCANA